LPIVYGNFALTAGEGVTKNIVSGCSNCVAVDLAKYKMIIANHKCFSNADTYQYVEQLKVKQSIDGFDISTTPVQASDKGTSYSGTYYTMLDTTPATITGALLLYPKMKGNFSDFSDFTFDRLDGLNPYKLDAGDVISFRFDAYENAPALGKFNDQTSVVLKMDFTNTIDPPGAVNNIQVMTYDQQTPIDTLNTIITGSQAVGIDYSSIFTITDWDWSKLVNLEFKVTNLYATPTEYIWINKIYLYVYYYYAKGYYGVGKRIPYLREGDTFYIKYQRF